MGSCAAPSAKGDDKFITTDYLQQCLTGCVSQDKGNAMQSQLNNQQRQINELSVRLQSAESRLSKQEEKLRNELLQSSGYCYLNGARYSTGTVLYGRICQNQSGSASWQVYSRR
ncbi:hypothetical protein OZH72_22425 [Escherichia coli]|uniref:hypothetical protein n=1 Tax=Escherichia coli TaxID=562 RepID=UPI0022852DAC|nr:hypothetical protein [Escherichia coli]MCZ0292531.1 hypothetical protein [Escherichia coli]